MNDVLNREQSTSKPNDTLKSRDVRHYVKYLFRDELEGLASHHMHLQALYIPDTIIELTNIFAINKTFSNSSKSYRIVRRAHRLATVAQNGCCYIGNFTQSKPPFLPTRLVTIAALLRHPRLTLARLISHVPDLASNFN